MALRTPCQTTGANFSVYISGTGVAVGVTFGKKVELTDRQAEMLEANLHNAVELVLAPYWNEENGIS